MKTWWTSADKLRWLARLILGHRSSLEHRINAVACGSKGGERIEKMDIYQWSPTEVIEGKMELKIAHTQLIKRAQDRQFLRARSGHCSYHDQQ